MGTTQVRAHFDQHRYTVELTVDPESVVPRLQFLAGESLRTATSASEYATQMRALQKAFLQTVTIRFDEKVVIPGYEYVPVSTDPTKIYGIVRLTGAIPPGSKRFHWAYSLVYTSYSLQLQNGAEIVSTQWLEGAEDSKPFALDARTPAQRRWDTVVQYAKLGYTHILPKGLDHILFVLGLFLLATSWRSLLTQVTAFTVAHSITLALSIYGKLSLPGSIVEPLIALSIVYVAVENLTTREVRPWRVALVFVFGLLHGMGFAGVLSQLGLPRSEFATALISFNVGVELGQLSVIAGAFVLISSWARKKAWYRSRVIVPLSLLIAATGLYWTVTRIFF